MHQIVVLDLDLASYILAYTHIYSLDSHSIDKADIASTKNSKLTLFRQGQIKEYGVYYDAFDNTTRCEQKLSIAARDPFSFMNTAARSRRLDRPSPFCRELVEGSAKVLRAR